MEKQPARAWIGACVSLGLTACPSNNDACMDVGFDGPPPEPSPSDNAPPTVLEGEWLTAGLLELTFSKPLSLGSAPSPRRFALVSWSAEVNSYYNCTQSTQYREFGRVGYAYSYQGTIADVWIAPEDARLLRIRLASSGAQCPNSTQAREQGLMLAYTGGDAEPFERLFDAEGEAVPSFGPEWSLSSNNGWADCVLGGSNYCSYQLSAYYNGHLPLADSVAPIPCP